MRTRDVAVDVGPVHELPDDTLICQCRQITKGAIAAAVRTGHASLASLGHDTTAGTGCTSCHDLLDRLIKAYKPHGPGHPAPKPIAPGGISPAAVREAFKPSKPLNSVERAKLDQDGLDSLPDILEHAAGNDWESLSEDDKARFKWHGLFFRKQTPGHFMLRLRMTCGASNARQFRVIAALSEEYGKGFCDLTTRQQIQLRWFGIGDVPDMWERLSAVGLHSKQTGMDNVRGVVGCPLAGLASNELFDASSTAHAFTNRILDDKAFTNLPRKFNVTITGCRENCCHTETQDLALIPASFAGPAGRVLGFNVLVGGKQGSGGYTPAEPLNVFVPPHEAADICAEIVGIYRDYGRRDQRNKARLRFLIEEKGVHWFRGELESRLRRPLPPAGVDERRQGHNDHLGIQPQAIADSGPRLYSVGLLVPVGRITSSQLRAVAHLADRYGTGDIRLTVGQNLVIVNVTEDKLELLKQEPIVHELPHDPSPVMRGLVSCVGSDYCHFALIETKGWAIEVARELERRTAGRKLLPLTIHWSGCPAGCGLHQAATIGLQGCRSRVDGTVADAAHVFVNGRAGPAAQAGQDLMYDVPCERLADMLEGLVRHMPRE
jgi:ferredoxin-nitrite reductase